MKKLYSPYYAPVMLEEPIADESHCSIISYMTKQSLPSVTTVTAENLDEFKAMDSVSLLAYFAEDDTANRDAFKAVAENLRNDYLFGTTSDTALAKDAGVSQPAIVMYKDFDDGKDIYDGKLDEESITAFAKASSTPLVGEVGPETYSSYMAVCTYTLSTQPQLNRI